MCACDTEMSALISGILALNEVTTEGVRSHSNRKGRQAVISTKESNMGWFSVPVVKISFIESRNKTVISKDWKGVGKSGERLASMY